MYIKFIDIFTDTPGGRYRDEGKFSAEEFRDDILILYLKKCIDSNEEFILDLDGAYGYPPGFLEETFGGLIRKNIFDTRTLQKTIKIICKEDEKVKKDIDTYMKEEIERQNNMKEGKKYGKYKRK